MIFCCFNDILMLCSSFLLMKYTHWSNILRNEESEPIYKLVKHHELIEPQQQEQPTAFEASFWGENGVVIRFGTREEKQASS